VQDVEQLDSGGAVEQAVVQLEEVGGLSAGQVLDEDRLPQRAHTIERGHRQHLGHLEHVLERPVLGEAGAPQVVAEVELVVHRPRRRVQAQRVLDDVLLQARDQVNGPVVRGDEAIPVRCVVEHVEDHAAGAQAR
jgi:hypothetical protein